MSEAKRPNVVQIEITDLPVGSGTSATRRLVATIPGLFRYDDVFVAEANGADTGRLNTPDDIKKLRGELLGELFEMGAVSEGPHLFVDADFLTELAERDNLNMATLAPIIDALNDDELPEHSAKPELENKSLERIESLLRTDRIVELNITRNDIMDAHEQGDVLVPEDERGPIYLREDAVKAAINKAMKTRMERIGASVTSVKLDTMSLNETERSEWQINLQDDSEITIAQPSSSLARHIADVTGFGHGVAIAVCDDPSGHYPMRSIPFDPVYVGNDYLLRHGTNLDMAYYARRTASGYNPLDGANDRDNSRYTFMKPSLTNPVTPHAIEIEAAFRRDEASDGYIVEAVIPSFSNEGDEVPFLKAADMDELSDGLSKMGAHRVDGKWLADVALLTKVASQDNLAAAELTPVIEAMTPERIYPGVISSHHPSRFFLLGTQLDRKRDLLLSERIVEIDIEPGSSGEDASIERHLEQWAESENGHVERWPKNDRAPHHHTDVWTINIEDADFEVNLRHPAASVLSELRTNLANGYGMALRLDDAPNGVCKHTAIIDDYTAAHLANNYLLEHGTYGRRSVSSSRDSLSTEIEHPERTSSDLSR